jgi:hypothetical protein
MNLYFNSNECYFFILKKNISNKNIQVDRFFFKVSSFLIPRRFNSNNAPKYFKIAIKILVSKFCRIQNQSSLNEYLETNRDNIVV